MFAIFFILMCAGTFFSTVFTPIATFLINNSISIIIFCTVCLLVYSVHIGRKYKSIAYGVGHFIGFSQLWIFTISALLSIAETCVTESDGLLSLLISLFVGSLCAFYISFNYKMLKSALAEVQENQWYIWVVGIVGWIIIIILSL
jgi:hypothetical protein